MDTGKATIEVLILNGEIVLAEGELVDWNGDGSVDAGDNNGRLADFSGISTLTVGARIDDVVDIYFTADIDFNGTSSTSDDLEGFFRLRIGECPADTNGDGAVNVDDLVAVIICWGTSGENCPEPGVSTDTNGDGVVGVDDLVEVIVGWGSCG